MFRTFILVVLTAATTATRFQMKPSRSKLGFLERGARSMSKSGTMASLYPFYHTTDAIKMELQALASRCHGMQLETVAGHGDDGQERDIDVVTIRASGDATPAANRVFMLFGEHSRELISPESGLHFIKTLCGETDLSPQATQVLKDSEFRIVVNGNPASRQKVEQGDFCLRVNPDGVDLNRNWDEQWQPSDDDMGLQQTNSGPKPFSEPETRVFKELVQQYKPTTFLTVHSGTKGMYMPWAYDMEHLAQRNQPQMMQILKTLDRDHCQCPFGAAGKEVGYSCPGTCLDWVYDQLNTPFAFAFEIYTGPEYSDMLRERWQEKMRGAGAFYQKHSHLGHRHFHEVFTEHPSCFVQLKRHHAARVMSNDECFGQFNPDSEDEYNSVVENWSSAYLSMASMVVQDLRGNSTDATMVVAA